MEIETWLSGKAGQAITQVRKFLEGNQTDQAQSTSESFSEPRPIEPTNGAGVMPLDPPQDDVSQSPVPDIGDDE